MAVNVGADQKREDTSARQVPYYTVRERITEELEAIQKSTKGEDIYEIHRSFEAFASKKKLSGKLIDTVLGFCALLIFLLLYPFIALGIKLSSQGPVIYKQLRTGKGGDEFICYKFRTMHQIDLRRIDGKPTITKAEDKRVFGFGKFLRRTSLDELPQILNVMKGDMSLIGPRPYPVRECSYWNTKFDDYYYRYSAKPGITGLAQINGYRGGTLNEEHMRKRLNYDLIYVKNCSMKLNLHIIGRTFDKIIRPDANAH